MKTSPIHTYRLEGSMTSAYPGYCGSFRACVMARSVRTAKRRFEATIHRNYPAAGIEAPLVAPILRFTAAAKLGDEAVWGIVSIRA